MDRDDVGVLAEADHGFDRDIDAGDLRPVIDDERNARLVGHRAVVEHLRVGAVDQVLVVVGRAHHGGFVAHLRGPVGEADGLPHTLHAGAGDQQLIRCGALGHLLP